MNKPRGSRDQAVELTGAKSTVRNGDVNGALRKMKKVLDNNNWQKDLSKNEYYEQPSIARKRAKSSAAKRWQKRVAENTLKGIWAPYVTTRTKYLKSRRKRRAMMEHQEVMRRVRRRTQQLGQ